MSTLLLALGEEYGFLLGGFAFLAVKGQQLQAQVCNAAAARHAGQSLYGTGQAEQVHSSAWSL